MSYEGRFKESSLKYYTSGQYITKIARAYTHIPVR